MKRIWDEKMNMLIKGEKTEPSSEEEEKKNYLYPDNKQPENNLLPGIGGGPLPESTEEKSGEALLLGILENGLANLTAPSESEVKVESAAGTHLSSAESLRSEADQKGDTLYSAISEFFGKQDGRYDSLLSQISEKGYSQFAGVSDLLSLYEKAGDEAVRHTLASIGADNAGNMDSYAAAQAARSRESSIEAGLEAALAYYNDQLDRWLSTIQAAGKDGASLLGLMQDNVDTLHDAASEEGDLASSLFSTLQKQEGERRDERIEAFSALLSHYADKNGTDTPEISPMELDREYEKLIEPGAGIYPKYSPTEALILLWKKYPSMQDYLLKKYKELQNPSYEYGTP